MKKSPMLTQNLNRMGRTLPLLFNRATMYQVGHPYIKQSIDDFYSILLKILEDISPLVFIMNQEQLFIDEDPIDPRVNVSRIVSHFKKTEMRSISFEKGLNKNEVRAFLEIFTNLGKYPNAEAMKKGLSEKGVVHLKINHVFYKKVTEDDEVITKEVFEKITPEMTDEAEQKSKKLFMDMVLEQVLAEELEKTVTMKNLLNNPQGLSQNMIEADLRRGDRVGKEEGAGAGSGAGLGPGAGPGAGGGPGADGDPAAGGGLGAGLGPGTGAGPGGGAGPDTGMAEAGPGIVTGLDPSAAAAGTTAEASAGTAAEGPAGMAAGMPADEADGAEDSAHGSVLLYQLQLLTDEVERNLAEGGEANMSMIADAVFQMKNQLIAGIESQKALNVAYDHEDLIVNQVNELTDKVIIKLVKDEYKAGKITTSRMATIIRRLIPEADELKRLLPKIKAALLEEGMPLSDYVVLLEDLSKELQSEGLAKILKAGSEEVGLDGEELIQEMKENPVEVAELISLAAEIKKGTGDEKLLTDIMVDYVERLGTKLGRDAIKEEGEGEEKHLRKVMTGVESGIVKRLKKMDVSSDVIENLETRLNERMDAIMDKMRREWVRSQSGLPPEDDKSQLSVLQILEQGVTEGEELGEILKAVRSQVEAGEIDENDFKQIYAEIARQKQLKREKEAKRKLPTGVLKTGNFMLFLEKEISRAKRYDTPFATLSYTIVKAKPENPVPAGAITQTLLIEAALTRLYDIVRDTDIVGLLGKNTMVAILPMTPPQDAKLALKRSMRLLHAEPVEVGGYPVDVKMAGVATIFHSKRTPDIKSFIKTVSSDLMDMSIRVKNIHALT